MFRLLNTNPYIRRLISSPTLRLIYVSTHNFLFYPRGYESRYKYLQTISPFDYTTRIKVHKYYHGLSGYSSVYSHHYSIMNYSGLTQNLLMNSHITHGFYFAGYELSVLDKYVDNIIVMSDQMKNRLSNLLETKGLTKNIISLGPFIRYAPDLNYRFNQTEVPKSQKTLLVFLPHNIALGKRKTQLRQFIYTSESIVEYLNKYQKIYTKIIVLDFYHNSTNEARDYYINKGFLYALAGHPFDPYFLARLKSVINLSDHSISFTFSSHIGHVLALGKSHEIVNIFNNKVPDNSNKNYFLGQLVPYNLNSYVDYLNSLELSDLDVQPTIEEDLLENNAVIEFFNKGNHILSEQVKLANNLFGLDILISPNELASKIGSSGIDK